MQEPVLVLNANYEPINICTTRRAVVLVLGGKADMVANGRGYVHTVTLHIPRPSVIRLQIQVRVFRNPYVRKSGHRRSP